MAQSLSEIGMNKIGIHSSQSDTNQDDITLWGDAVFANVGVGLDFAARGTTVGTKKNYHQYHLATFVDGSGNTLPAVNSVGNGTTAVMTFYRDSTTGVPQAQFDTNVLFKGDVYYEGDFKIGTLSPEAWKFVVLKASGNTDITGNLTVRGYDGATEKARDNFISGNINNITGTTNKLFGDLVVTGSSIITGTNHDITASNTVDITGHHINLIGDDDDEPSDGSVSITGKSISLTGTTTIDAYSGNIVITGANLDVTGNTHFKVNSAQVDITGPTSITGNTIITGEQVDITGNTHVKVKSAAVDITGITKITGNTIVTGEQVDITGNTHFKVKSAAVDITGPTSITGNTIVTGEQVDITGNTHFKVKSAAIDITGPTSITGNTIVTGEQVDITGNTHFKVKSAQVDIIAATSITGNTIVTGEQVDITGNTHVKVKSAAIDITGITKITGNTSVTGEQVDITGSTHVKVKSAQVDVTGVTKITGNTTVSGGELELTGNTYVKITGDTTVRGILMHQGNLTVTGTADIQNNTTVIGGALEVKTAAGESQASLFKVNPIGGNDAGTVFVYNNFDVTSESQLDGNVTIGYSGQGSEPTLTVNGITVTTGNVTLTGLSSTLLVGKGANSEERFKVDGQYGHTTSDGFLHFKGIAQSANTAIHKILGPTQIYSADAIDATGKIEISGKKSIQLTGGEIDITGSIVDITGDTSVRVKTTQLEITGLTKITGSTSITGNTIVTGEQVDITGNTHVKVKSAAVDITGPTSITGNTIVTGEQVDITGSTHVKVKSTAVDITGATSITGNTIVTGEQVDITGSTHVKVKSAAVDITGSTSITGNTIVTGEQVDITGNTHFKVKSAAVDITGPTSITGNTIVTGEQVDITGNTHVKVKSAAVDITGATSITGNTIVTGEQVDITGSTHVKVKSAAVDITGITSITGNTIVTGEQVDITGNTHVKVKSAVVDITGPTSITGNTTITGDLVNITGNSGITLTGNTQIEGTQKVSSHLTVTGTSNLHNILNTGTLTSVGGAAVIGANGAEQTLTHYGDLIRNGNENVTGDLVLTGDVQFKWTSAVGGDKFQILGNQESAAAFLSVANDGKLTVAQDAIFKSSAVVRGNLTVLGQTATVHATDFAVKDKEIILGHYELNDTDTNDNPDNTIRSDAETNIQVNKDTMSMCFGVHSDMTTVGPGAGESQHKLLGGCIKFAADKGWELYQADGLEQMSGNEGCGRLTVNGEIRCKNKLVITNSYLPDSGGPDTSAGAVELKYVPANGSDKAYVVLQQFDDNNPTSSSTKIFAKFYEQN